MFTTNQIKALISKMSTDDNRNIKMIKKLFGSLEYVDGENQSLLHILVDNKYDEDECFFAIRSLLRLGLNPNLEDDYNYNFIQTALYAGYREPFIIKIIEEALQYNLDVNHVDGDKDTIMHTAIYSDDYLGGVENIYKLLCCNGFDSMKLDLEGRNLIEAMIFQKQYSKQQIESFEKIFNKQTCGKLSKKDPEQLTIDDKRKQEILIPTIQTLSTKEILELEKYGKILNNNNYVVSPTIGREQELKNLMVTLAQEKKNPLIVGESGVGKTALVDELAFRIKMRQVPSFLQGKIILEVDPSLIVAGCSHVGQFEEKMLNLIRLWEKYNIIMFIDEIHTIYGLGAATDKNNDMSEILKRYLTRTNLKLIGTTTEVEYNNFFTNSALKRRFERIGIKEPSDDILYQIINKVLKDYCISSGILLSDENLKERIIKIILNATSKSHRVYNDRVNNPDLAISIIDKAFAFAKFYDSEFINKDHFIESFKCCNRIYESTINSAIDSLNQLDNNKFTSKSKVLKIDFNKQNK